MPLVATSLKLPAQLKKRLVRLAGKAGESPHALMVRALQRHADQVELYEKLLDDADRADAEMRRSGEGFAMDDVHKYFSERLQGRSPRKPRPVRWRR